jgi:TP901 family phage tail tape measure protein
MLNALGLGWVFKAKDEASHVAHHVKDGIKEVKKAADEAGESTAKFLGMSGKAIAATAVAIAAVGAGAAFEFAEHAEHFSQAIRQAGVASHATAAQMHELEELALNKGFDSIRASSMKAGETLAELAKEGYDAQQAGEALNGTLRLMSISMGALGPRAAAGLVNDTLGQFNMQASQAEELTDKLAFAMKNFGFRAEEVQGAMSGLAAGATLTGASLDDTLIGVGLIKTVLPSATKSAAAMNAAMNQLASTHGQKELRGIGVAVTDNTGKIKPLIDILGQLAVKTKNMTDAQVAHKLSTIAGGKAAGGLSVIMDALRKGVKDAEGNVITGAVAIEHLRAQIGGAGGTAKKMSDVLNNDLGGSLKALKGGFSNLAILIGEPFEHTFKGIVDTLNLFVRGIGQLFKQGGFSGEVKDELDKHLGIKGFAIGVFVWIKRIENFFSNLKQSFMTTFEPFRPLLDQLGVAFRALGQALGIVDQTADDNASTWDTFGSAGAGVGEILANIAGSVIPVLGAAIELLTGAVQIARDVWRSLTGALGGFGQMFKGVFELIAGILTGDWKRVWDGFVDIVFGALKMILRLATGSLGMLAGMFDAVASKFGFDSGLKTQIEDLRRMADSGLDFAAVKVKGVVEPTAQPAAAAVAQTSNTAAAVAGAAAAGAAGAAGEQVIHNHMHVSVDGEKLVEAHAAAKRSARTRSFEPVPAHGM